LEVILEKTQENPEKVLYILNYGTKLIMKNKRKFL